MSGKKAKRRRPPPAQPKYRPGDPVLLHARVIKLKKLGGKSVVTCRIRGWPTLSGIVYLPVAEVDPDPQPE